MDWVVVSIQRIQRKVLVSGFEDFYFIFLFYSEKIKKTSQPSKKQKISHTLLLFLCHVLGLSENILWHTFDTLCVKANMEIE